MVVTRFVPLAVRSAARHSQHLIVCSRQFSSSSRSLQEAAAAVAPPKKPIGGFRGGLFGFLLGSTLSGAGMYYYVLNEYRVSNELLTEDIYNLLATVHRVEGYVKDLEEKGQNDAKKK